MDNLVLGLTFLFSVMSFLATNSYILMLLGIPLYFVLGFMVSSIISYAKELVSDSQRPPIAGLMMNQLIHFKRLFDYQVKLARKYRTYRLITSAESHVYTADPLNIEYILKTNFPNYCKGEDNYDVMKDLLGDGIFVVDGDKWRHQRKLASYEFSAKVLRGFSSNVFRSNAAKLAVKVYEEANAGREMDLQALLMKSAMDTMFKVGFGVDLDSLSGSDEMSNQFIKAFDNSNFIIYWRYVDPLWKIKRSLNIGLERNLKNNIKFIDSFVYKLIQRRREQMKITEEGVKEDILSRFLVESEKGRENMTDRYLRDIILNFLIAGKDSSANTLSWFFYVLCKHPLIQEKAVLEVKSVADVTETILSIDEFVLKLTEASLDRMHYLHAALTETLRLYPAVPLLNVNGASWNNHLCLHACFSTGSLTCMDLEIQAMDNMVDWIESSESGQSGLFFSLMQYVYGPDLIIWASNGSTIIYEFNYKDGKQSKEDDVLPDGHRIKKGDGISYTPYAMGRMTYLWGEDADEFNPERWLRNGIFQAESPFKFTAFQAGPRVCLGKEFAYRQMKIIATTLLFFFKFRLADDTKTATYRTMFTLHMDNGLPLYALPRYNWKY